MKAILVQDTIVIADNGRFQLRGIKNQDGSYTVANYNCSDGFFSMGKWQSQNLLYCGRRFTKKKLLSFLDDSKYSDCKIEVTL